MVKTKTSIAVDLFKSGDFRGSLRYFKSFRIGLTRNDRDVLIMAHEILSGSGDLYRQIGHDVDRITQDAKEIIKNFVTSYDQKKES
jgi:hypothetical protein